MDVRLIAWAGYELKGSATVTVDNYIPVCDPEMTAYEDGVLHVYAEDYRPSIKAEIEEEDS